MRSYSLLFILFASLQFFLNGWAFDGHESDQEELTSESTEEDIPHDLDYYRWKLACYRNKTVNSMIDGIDNADVALVVVICLDKLKMFHHARKASGLCTKLLTNAKSARRVASNLEKRHYCSVNAAEQAIELSKSFEDAFLALKLCLKLGLKGLLKKGEQKCIELAADDPVKIEILDKYIEENKGELQEEEGSEEED
jgi:hypothetical protein